MILNHNPVSNFPLHFAKASLPEKSFSRQILDKTSKLPFSISLDRFIPIKIEKRPNFILSYTFKVKSALNSTNLK